MAYYVKLPDFSLPQKTICVISVQRGRASRSLLEALPLSARSKFPFYLFYEVNLYSTALLLTRIAGGF